MNAPLNTPSNTPADESGANLVLHRLRRTVAAEATAALATPTAKVLLVASMALAAASCLANLAVIDDAELGDDTTLEIAMHASTVATLIFAAASGVIFASADFRFGRIDQLLLTEPIRPLVLAAKALVSGAIGLLYGAAGAVVAVAATTSMLRANGVTVDVSSPLIVQPVIGVMIGASLFAIVGTSVGFVVKNQPAAITVTLAGLLVVEPTALLGLPSFGRWLPGAAGLALTNSPDPNLLEPTVALMLLAGYAVGSVAVANHRFRSASL